MATPGAAASMDLIEERYKLLQNPSKILGLTVNGTKITPGQYFPKADAQAEPVINFDGSAAKSYIAVGVDPDAPDHLKPILHWIQPGLKAENHTLKATEPFVCNYVGPAPPAGSDPHRYGVFLFEQPEDFDGSKWAPAGGEKMGLPPRMKYDLAGWEKEAGLGDVVAVGQWTSN